MGKVPYIGNRMSVNAKLAHDRGLLPVSSIGRKELDQCGFSYSVGFFRWLCKKRYIFPREFHHTGASKRMTGFYSPDNIKNFSERANLPLLYELYRNKRTFCEAVEALDLRYYRMECIRSVLGLAGVGSVIIYVVYYRGMFYLSKKKKLLRKNMYTEQYRILAEYKKGDAGWKNSRGKEIEQYILVFASKKKEVGVSHSLVNVQEFIG
ncbi:MAG: hypothetical protein LUG54_04565 [Clostridiales bacterium]|nr:hypothetical protein [Clostridiales bacterium]